MLSLNVTFNFLFTSFFLFNVPFRGLIRGAMSCGLPLAIVYGDFEVGNHSRKQMGAHQSRRTSCNSISVQAGQSRFKYFLVLVLESSF